MIDPNLLSKIRAVKALRDRGATDGEKDAAQNRLTLLLAKHNLTEQDIAPSTSRNYRSTSRPPSDFFDWDMVRRAAQRQRRSSSGPDFATHGFQRGAYGTPPVKKNKARERFEKALGHSVSEQTWRYVKRAQTRARSEHLPKNASAFARAFYEWAGIFLREATTGQVIRTARSANALGKEAATTFARNADPAPFRAP